MKIKGVGLGKHKKGSTPPQMIMSKTGKVGKNCTGKQKFQDKLEADVCSTRYNDRLALMFSPVESYYCTKHKSWHIGHKFEEERVTKNEF